MKMDNFMFRPFWQTRRDCTKFFKYSGLDINKSSWLSSSLAMAKRQERNRARMTAFIFRKTAETLPFGFLTKEELLCLGTNTSVPCEKPRVAHVTTATQTDMFSTHNVRTMETQTEDKPAIDAQSAATQTEEQTQAPSDNIVLMIREACLTRDLEIERLARLCNDLQFELERASKENAELRIDNEQNTSKLLEFNCQITYLQDAVNSKLSQGLSNEPQTYHSYNRGRRRRGRFN
jgi:hypothetical protein